MFIEFSIRHRVNSILSILIPIPVNSKKSIPMPPCKKNPIPSCQLQFQLLKRRLRKNSNPICFNKIRPEWSDLGLPVWYSNLVFVLMQMLDYIVLVHNVSIIE